MPPIPFAACLVLAGLALSPPPQAALVISGVFDIPAGDVRGIEVTATADIPDLSVYGVATDKSETDATPVEFIFPMVGVSANTSFFLIRNGRLDEFVEFFGFTPPLVFEDGTFNIDGKDSVAIYTNLVDTKGKGKVGDHTGTLVDVMGDLGEDGKDTFWDFRDGWLHRNAGEGPNPVFTPGEWTASGRDALDDFDTNAEAATFGMEYPIPEPRIPLTLLLGTISLLARRRRGGRARR